MAAAPSDAVALFEAKLRPATMPTAADLDRLTAQLGAAEFADREKATAELEKFGFNAVDGVKARLAGVETPEVRDRLTRFLSDTRRESVPYELRCVRAVAALELLGTPEAKRLLAGFAKGNPDDVLTREASAAHRRLGNL